MEAVLVRRFREKLSSLVHLLVRSDDPGRERYRRALLTSLMNMVSQVVQLATGLISVPLVLNYMGNEMFGLWMALSSALAFITFSDLGIGIGVQDKISRAVTPEERMQASAALLSALWFVFGLCTLLLAAGWMVVWKVDLAALFSLRSQQAISGISSITFTVILVLCIGLLAGVIQRAFTGLQDGFWVALIQMLARLLSLGLLLLLVRANVSLSWIIFAVSGLSAVAMLLFGSSLLWLRHRWLFPENVFSSLLLPSVGALREVLRIGLLGLSASIAIYLVNNSPMILMSQKFGAEGVVDYAVLLKLIGIPSILLTYITLPLWPAISEAKANGDWRWIKKVYARCARVAIGMMFVSAISVFWGGQKIILLWTKSEAAVPSKSLLLACVAFMVLGFWNALSSVILNGLSRFLGQATYGLLVAVLFLFIAALSPNSLGKESVVWIVAFGYLLRCIFMQGEVNVCFRSMNARQGS